MLLKHFIRKHLRRVAFLFLCDLWIDPQEPKVSSVLVWRERLATLQHRPARQEWSLYCISHLNLAGKEQTRSAVVWLPKSKLLTPCKQCVWILSAGCEKTAWKTNNVISLTDYSLANRVPKSRVCLLPTLG